MDRPLRRLRVVTPLVMVLLCAGAWTSRAQAAASGSSPLPALQTGFTDPVFMSGNAGVRERWLTRAAEEHAAIVRLTVSWREIAPRRPSAADATDPGWRGYEFATLDRAIVSASLHGLSILVTVSEAPSWAEGAHPPKSAPSGTWRPHAAALGAFAQALALRYSGAFTPEGASAPLPAVRYWQAWNEPNLSAYLTPQWQATGARAKAASPGIYRNMLDAFYRGIHAAASALGARAPSERVLSAGTAPYGEPPGGLRMPPAEFVRDMLCLSRELRPERCPQHADFDILDHHPYSIEGPYWHALNRDDVAIADMGKLIRPLRAAERLHLVGGAKHHEVWVTEVSWDSDPPDPHGIPAATQALWLEQTLQLLWSEGVSAVLWYKIVDQPPVPSYATTYQSGAYLLDGRAKPSATAFRFPFVLASEGGKQANARHPLLWGKSPDGTYAVRIQAQSHGRWRTLEVLRPRRGNGIFEAAIPAGGADMRLRAVSGTLHSLTLRG